MALSNRYDALTKNTKGLESTEGLPLVVEIIPGTAGEGQGLLRAFQPGEYDLKRTTPAALMHQIMSKPESVFDSRVIDRLNREGTNHLFVGRKAHRVTTQCLADYAELRSEDGQQYVYLLLRSIKPQEGGHARSFDRRPGGALKGPTLSSS